MSGAAECLSLYVKSDSDIAATLADMRIYPSPFSTVTNVRVNLVSNEMVSLSVYNLLGEQVTTLFNGSLNAGEHTFTLDGFNLNAGVYFVTLKDGNHSLTKKIILTK